MGRGKTARILILGGGYVGFYAALGLQRRLRGGEASVTVVDPQPHMTYQPFLPEAAAGAIEPRHVVVPLRRTLKRCHVLTARVTKIAHEAKKVTVETPDGNLEDLDYDVLVVALGSVARLMPIPGLAEQGHRARTRWAEPEETTMVTLRIDRGNLVALGNKGGVVTAIEGDVVHARVSKAYAMGKSGP